MGTVEGKAQAQVQAATSWPSDAARRQAYSGMEERAASDVQASIIGRFPTWLKGTYMRNGPGEFSAFDAKHMFDGFALLSRFEVDGASNAVTASHAFVQSEAWRHFERTGRLRWREFGTPVAHDSLISRVAEMAGIILGTLGLSQGVTDNASVHVLPRPDGTIWALTETVQGTYAVDARSLETLGQVKNTDSIRGDLTTGHPTVLQNGDLINFISTVGLGFQLYRLPADAGVGGAPLERCHIATVPHRHPAAPAWVHDFPVSSRYAVIPEMPLYFNLLSLLTGGSTDYVFTDWKPEEGTRLHVIDLVTGATRTFIAPPFLVFHWANAFESEDGRYLHLDGAVYDDPEICNSLYLANVRAGPEEGRQLPRAYFRRLTIDLQALDNAAAVSAWQPLVGDEGSYGPFFEFPAVSPTAKGRPYRYAWGACATHPTNAANSLVKVDIETGTAQVWHEAGTLGGEPVFVPAPEPVSEDDGVVVAVLLQADGTTALLALDGRTHKEVARAVLPYGLTAGFHGRWLPAV